MYGVMIVGMWGVQRVEIQVQWFDTSSWLEYDRAHRLSRSFLGNTDHNPRMGYMLRETYLKQCHTPSGTTPLVTYSRWERRLIKAGDRLGHAGAVHVAAQVVWVSES